MIRTSILTFSLAGFLGGPALAATSFFSGSGDITGVVEDFRSALGPLNAPAPVDHPDGRREINWDAAPDSVSDPNSFPGDFFNFDAAPRARGIEIFPIDFTGPLGIGGDLALSSTAASGQPVRFGGFDASLTSNFTTFSAERLFSPLDTTITGVQFFLPSDQTTAATVDGFGAVFTGVDLPDSSGLVFFNEDGDEIADVAAPVSGPGGLSFAGATFDTSEVFGVLIFSGDVPINETLTPGFTGDKVALDDFIYGEPQAASASVPEPGYASALALLGVIGFVRRRRV